MVLLHSVSLATGEYTKASVEIARKHMDFVIGFVATRSLTLVGTETAQTDEEDFVIFTTSINQSSKDNKLEQQYQTPTSAVERGADFIIAGRGIYAAEDPAASVKLYQEEAWSAYLKRVGGMA